jgi:hypothetical protein
MKRVELKPALMLIAALGLGCVGPSNAPGDAEAKVPKEGQGLPEADEPSVVPPGECGGAITEPGPGALGAVGITESGKLFVAGNTNSVNPWQLGQVDVDAGTLKPVIQGDSSWIEEGWIGVEGEKVSVYEFYPRGVTMTFDATTGEVETSEQTQSPAYGNLAPHSHNGNRYWVMVSTSQEDDCQNVCVMKEDIFTEEASVLLDDGAENFQLHTGGVTFIGEWVYFMSYPESGSTGEGRALRRMNLDSGEVEKVFQLMPGAINSWISHLVQAEGGVLYWLRAEQPTSDDPYSIHIDRHFVATNETHAAFSDAPGHNARNLFLLDQRLFWTDANGLHTIDLVMGADAETLVMSGEGRTDVYYAVRGDRVYHSRTEYVDPAYEAYVGCAELPPRIQGGS